VEILILIIMLGLLVWTIYDIICLFSKKQRPLKKQIPTFGELEKNWHNKHGAWKDYGTTTSIMGHVFVANTVGGYEYKGLGFATNSFTGVNYYWILPRIAITQDEFLARLDRL
jgi:hypothetical protein